MKHLIWAFIAIMTIVGCQKNKQDAAATVVNTEKIADSIIPNKEKIVNDQGIDSIAEKYGNVALSFINEYKEDCDNRNNGKGVMVFVSESPYLTLGFKSELKRIMDEADKEDPEMGLGFDPIFDAQDYPDEGFELKSVNKKTGYVVVQGKDWKEFVLNIKIANVNGNWLVDGCGIVNIPSNKRSRG